MDHAHDTTKSNNEQDKAFAKEKMGERSGPQKKADPKEGPLGRTTKDRSARRPSDLFLWMAGASVLGSAALKMMEFVKTPRKERKGTLSLFVGMWAPTFLMLGLYNKLAKSAGAEQAPQKS